MFEFFANLFGYLLNFIYNLVNNYGLAMIIFAIVIKLCMLPLSIKQQKTMKKSAKLQEKMKVLQFKYKNDPEKLNQEMMSLYKEEKMSPFSGCLSGLVQLVLLVSIFYMVKSPLTFMKKMDTNTINTFVQQMKEDGKTNSATYPEIDIIRESEYLKEKNPETVDIEKININMKFLGLDLNKVPQQNLGDWTVYIIPILYIISTFVSMRITTSMQKKQNKKKEIVVSDDPKKETVEGENTEMDALAQTNKMMSWMMPIMSVSISLVAPLGLALYWLTNNTLMILERVILDRLLKKEDE